MSLSKPGTGGPLSFEGECEKCGLAVTVSIDRFKNPRYIDWIKSALCLQYTKEGLEPFVTRTLKDFHSSIEPKIQDASKCSNGCQIKDLGKPKFICPTGMCDGLMDHLLASSLSPRLEWTNSEWGSSGSEDMRTLPFELAKLFMPGFCKELKGPADADCTAILSLMINCRALADKIDSDSIVKEVRDSRNTIMHSGTMSLDEIKLLEHQTNCIKLLRDPIELQQDTDCTEAVARIEQLCKHNTRIEQLKEAETKVLDEYDKEKQDDVEHLKEAIESDDCTPEKLLGLKQQIKEHEERDAKLAVMMGVYNMDAKRTSDRKINLTNLHEKAEKKYAQMYTHKLEEKDEEITKVKKQADDERKKLEDQAHKLQKDLDSTILKSEQELKEKDNTITNFQVLAYEDIKKLKAKAADEIKELKDKASDEIKQLKDQAHNLHQKVDSTNSMYNHKLKEKDDEITNVKNQADDEIKKLKIQVDDVIKNLKDKADNELKKLKDQTDNESKKLRDQTDDEIKKVKNEADNECKKLKDQADYTCKKLKDQADDEIKKMNDKAYDEVKKVKDEADNERKKLKNQADDTCTNLKDLADNEIKKLKNQADKVNKWKYEFHDERKKLKDQVDIESKNLKDQAEDESKKLKNKAYEVIEEMKDQADQENQKRKDQADDETKNMKDQSDIEIKKLEQQALEEIKKMKDLADDVVKKLKDQTVDESKKLKDQTDDEIKKFKDQADDEREKLKDLADDERMKLKDESDNERKKLKDQADNKIKELKEMDLEALKGEKLEANAVITDVKHLRDISCKTGSDTNNCNLMGSVLLPGDILALTDNNNLKVKLLDTRQDKVVAELKVPGFPNGVCKVTDTQVAVATMDAKKIVFVETKQSLSISRELKVDGICSGVGYLEGKLLVSFIKPLKVEILDLQGTVLKEIDTDAKGKNLFNDPFNLAINPYNKLIYVSNYGSNEIVCMKLDGTVVAKYTDSELRGPWQVITDKTGKMLVCGRSSVNVHQITEDYKKVKVILTGAQGLSRPGSIAYSEKDDMLYIGQNSKDLKVFKLTFSTPM